MEFIEKNVHWLLPDELSPCDILLHFRGQFAVAIPKNQSVSFRVLEKLAKTQCSQIYIRTHDLPDWDKWIALRYPAVSPLQPAKDKDEENTKKLLYGNKRAELLSFVQKSLNKRAEGDSQLDNAFSAGLSSLKKVINLPSLDWYFKQFHEPPDLFHHNGRVAYSLAIFSYFHKLFSAENLETVIHSALIHELEGSLASNQKTVVSVKTIEYLERKQHPVASDVLELIKNQDELCSGKGFPDNKTITAIPPGVRIFTIFNHFDQYRALNTGTRRARYERTKQTMESRKDDYDPGLWFLFWQFWESKVEAVS